VGAGIEAAALSATAFFAVALRKRQWLHDPSEDFVTYDHTKPEAVHPTEAKTRACLVCKTSFQSEWSGERICRRCKSAKVWRNGAAAQRTR
jgi:hypothetical protein